MPVMGGIDFFFRNFDIGKAQLRWGRKYPSSFQHVKSVLCVPCVVGAGLAGLLRETSSFDGYERNGTRHVPSPQRILRRDVLH